MSTARQIAANKQNAQKSTGPRSEEGKAKSSLNHLSHGLTSSLNVVHDEQPEEFKALLIDLMTEYEPATPTEQILVEKMSTNQWLSLRAIRLQGESFLNQQIIGDSFAIPKDLGVLIRYHTTAENNFHKAHNELVKVQKERKKSEIGFESQKVVAPTQAEAKITPITTAAPPETTNSDAPDLERDLTGLPETRESLKNVA
jgi:hypothetical protein